MDTVNTVYPRVSVGAMNACGLPPADEYHPPLTMKTTALPLGLAGGLEDVEGEGDAELAAVNDIGRPFYCRLRGRASAARVASSSSRVKATAVTITL